MAKEPKFNCIENWIKKNPLEKFYEFPNQKDNRSYCVMWGTDIKTFWSFFPDYQWFKTKDGKRTEKGEWECDGNEGFIVISQVGKIWKSKNKTWEPYEGNTEENTADEPTTFSIQFSCIQKNKGDRVNIDSNGEYAWYWVDEPNKVAHLFFKDGKWAQTKNNANQFTGRWNCDEDNHFLIVSDDKQSYSSRSDNWEKITSIGDINDSFPLKFESEGPNVVKLQKFLNDKIRTNPLTVNGIFDQKTQDKLIEFQKKEGIIE